jgi:hypothetical protein
MQDTFCQVTYRFHYSGDEFVFDEYTIDCE